MAMCLILYVTGVWILHNIIYTVNIYITYYKISGYGNQKLNNGKTILYTFSSTIQNQTIKV